MEVFDNRRKNVYLVEAVLEVRICPDLWEEVCRAAEMRGRSYSWVVRYCLFRLIKRKSAKAFIGFAGNPRRGIFCMAPQRFSSYNEMAWARRGGSNKHRHRLCLYGEDELYIRAVAASLRCTMTHLVRLALLRYLGSLFRVEPLGRDGRLPLSPWFFYWLGIKLQYGVEIPALASEKVHFNFIRFTKSHYF